MVTIGESVSRVRNLIKGAKADAFLTDHFIYSLIKKHGRWLMRRADASNKIMKLNSVFQQLNYVELEKVDAIDIPELDFASGIVLRRTHLKVPTLMEGYWGPIIRSVTSIDRSVTLVPTFPQVYENIASQKNFKYNTKKYFWYLDGYLYFPNMNWDAVRIEAVFEEDISRYTLDSRDDCLRMQERRLNIPEFLLAEVESNIKKDFFDMVKIPNDTQNDNKNVLRP